MKTIRYLTRNRWQVYFKITDTGTDDGHRYGHKNKRLECVHSTCIKIDNRDAIYESICIG